MKPKTGRRQPQQQQQQQQQQQPRARQLPVVDRNEGKGNFANTEQPPQPPASLTIGIDQFEQNKESISTSASNIGSQVNQLAALQEDQQQQSQAQSAEETGATDTNEQATFCPSLSPKTKFQDDGLSSMSETLTVLKTTNGSEVYIVGTAHFSTKSAQDVRKVIRSVKPSAVVLELCNERAYMLDMDEQSLLEQNRNLTFQKVRDAIAHKGLAQGLIYVTLIKLSATLTESLGMAPGSEFRAGAAEAREIPGCRIVLGDRSLRVTVARAVASISLWQKLKLVYQATKNDLSSITVEDVENCKEKDILERLLQELGGEFPGFKRTLLDERNVFLAHSIYSWAERSETRIGPQKLVAVVGIGHVGGIVENWGHTTDEQVGALNEVPETSRTVRIVRKSIKYCSIALLVYVGYRVFTPSSLQSAVQDKIASLRS